MSEEELVILQNIQYALDNVGSFDFGDFSFDDIQGLLNLYQNEKEKNEKLNKLKCFGLLEIFNMGKEGARQRIKHDWVEKDKIREELTELDNMKVDGEVFTTAVNFAKNILKELLEEE